MATDGPNLLEQLAMLPEAAAKEAAEIVEPLLSKDTRPYRVGLLPELVIAVSVALAERDAENAWLRERLQALELTLQHAREAGAEPPPGTRHGRLQIGTAKRRENNARTAGQRLLEEFGVQWLDADGALREGPAVALELIQALRAGAAERDGEDLERYLRRWLGIHPAE